MCHSPWNPETDRIGLANFSDASECELPSDDGRALARSGILPVSQSKRVLEGVQTVIPTKKIWYEYAALKEKVGTYKWSEAFKVNELLQDVSNSRSPFLLLHDTCIQNLLAMRVQFIQTSTLGLIARRGLGLCLGPCLLN